LGNLLARATAFGCAITGLCNTEPVAEPGNQPAVVPPVPDMEQIAERIQTVFQESYREHRSLESIKKEKRMKSNQSFWGETKWCTASSKLTMWQALQELAGCVVDTRGVNLPFPMAVRDILAFQNDPDAKQVLEIRPPIDCDEKSECVDHEQILDLDDWLEIIGQKFRDTVEIKETRLAEETDPQEIEILKKDIDGMKMCLDLYIEKTFVYPPPLDAHPNNDYESKFYCDHKDLNSCTPAYGGVQKMPELGYEDNLVPQYDDEWRLFDQTNDYDEASASEDSGYTGDAEGGSLDTDDIDNLFDRPRRPGQ